MFKKILFLFFFIILISFSVSAFLISPPVLNVKYEPGLKNTYEVFIINNEDKIMELNTIVDYKCFNDLFSVTLNADKLIFNEGEYKKGFNFDLSLPSNLPTGKYEIRVGAEERLSGGMLGLKVANMVRIIIDNGGSFVTCDGVSSNVTLNESGVSGVGDMGNNAGGFSGSSSVNFEITSVKINDVVSGEKAELKIFVKNKGDGVEIDGVIDVIRNGLKVGTLKTNSDYLGKDSNIVLTSYINTVNLDPSEYLLKINVLGGSESRNNDAKFRVLCGSEGKIIGGYSFEIFILILILILILLVLFLMFRYIRKGKKSEEWEEDIFYQ